MVWFSLGNRRTLMWPLYRWTSRTSRLFNWNELKCRLEFSSFLGCRIWWHFAGIHFTPCSHLWQGQLLSSVPADFSLIVPSGKLGTLSFFFFCNVWTCKTLLLSKLLNISQSCETLRMLACELSLATFIWLWSVSKAQSSVDINVGLCVYVAVLQTDILLRQPDWRQFTTDFTRNVATSISHCLLRAQHNSCPNLSGVFIIAFASKPLSDIWKAFSKLVFSWPVFKSRDLDFVQF